MLCNRMRIWNETHHVGIDVPFLSTTETMLLTSENKINSKTFVCIQTNIIYP